MKRIVKIIVILLWTFEYSWAQEFYVDLDIKENEFSILQNTYPPFPITDKNIIDRFNYTGHLSNDIEFKQYYFYYQDENDNKKCDTINALIIKLPSKKTSVILDSNMDNNFENEQAYLFDETVRSHMIKLPVRRDRNNNGNNLDKIFKLNLVTEKMGTLEVERFTIRENWYYFGGCKWDNNELEVNAWDEYHYLTGEKKLYVAIRKNKELNRTRAEAGGDVLIDNKIYSITGDFKRLYFKYLKDIEYSFFPAIDFVTKKQLKQSDFQGKYLLIDFWGSWCGPCIKGIPELRSLREKFNKNLEIISVAYENDEDLSKLNKVITENNMDWPQIYYLRNKKDPKINGSQYMIELFPTFLLIDPNGKIIVRVEGTNKLKEIEDLMIKKTYTQHIINNKQ